MPKDFVLVPIFTELGCLYRRGKRHLSFVMLFSGVLAVKCLCSLFVPAHQGFVVIFTR